MQSVAGEAGTAGAAKTRPEAKLDLFSFVPFRLNRLAAEVSAALSSEYQQRYGLDIPEWRVLATLGFRNDACSAQYIAHCTRTHKSTISRAVTALMKRQLVERVENPDDRREFVLRMTRKGKDAVPGTDSAPVAQGAGDLSCLSAQERKDFAATARQDRAESRSGADQQAGRPDRGVYQAGTRSAPADHFTAVTTISTICGVRDRRRCRPASADCCGSTHSSQARFISLFRLMSVM